MKHYITSCALPIKQEFEEGKMNMAFVIQIISIFTPYPYKS